MLCALKCFVLSAFLSMAVAELSTSDSIPKTPGTVDLTGVSKAATTNQTQRRMGKSVTRRRRSISVRHAAFDALQAHLDQDLASLLEKAAREMPVTSSTFALLRSFRPCTTCKNHRRFGEPHDGGYIMCQDDLKPGQIKAAYSYGINGFDGWGNDVSKAFQVPVFEYDCTNPRRPQACPSCDLRFNLECIAEHSSHAPSQNKETNYGTLTQHLQQNGHHEVSEGSLLMKIDIEGAEWQIFAEEPIDNLKRFHEIVVEFHNLAQVEKHELYLRAAKNILNAGFVVYHIHGNNNDAEAHFGTKRVPNVLEVTYVRRPAGGDCTSNTVTVPEDAVNNANRGELEPAQLMLFQRSAKHHGVTSVAKAANERVEI